MLAALASAIVLLSFAAAGPALARSGARVRILVDRTVSTSALLDDGRTTADAALARARTLVAAAVPGAEVVVEDAPGPRDRDVDAQAAAVRLSGEAPGCVLATDRAVASDAGEVVAIGPGAAARPNVGIERASLVGGAAVVVVRNHGGEAVRVRLTGAEEAGREIDLPARASVDVRLPAPPRGEHATYRVAPGGGLAADDVVRVHRRGGAARVRVAGSGPRIDAALRALGVEVATAGDADATVRRGGAVARDAETPVVHFAPSGAEPGAPLGLIAGADTVGASVVARGDFPLPAPAARIAAAWRVTGGDPLLEDAAGGLAARAGRAVVLTADPESDASDWGRDGSFAAALAAALDLVTDGPDRLVPEDPLPAGEAGAPAPAPEDPEPESIRRVASRSPGIPLDGLAALCGGLAAALAAVLGARR